MAVSPQHVSLAAGEVATLTFDYDYPEIEVLNLDGMAEVYIRADGGTPEVGANGCDVLPAAICSMTTRPGTTGPTVVRLVSSSSTRVSVRGVGR